jgi:hypothetical protein
LHLGGSRERSRLAGRATLPTKAGTRTNRSYFGAIERVELDISLDTIVKIAARLDTKPSALCTLARL